MKFSIITCTYNSAKFLKKNIDSVKNQNYIDWEHVFIDGFSNDQTIGMIREYQKEFPEKVKLFQFAPEGISRAMNDGIARATGEYLIHLHSDDSFYDSKLLDDVNVFLNGCSYDWIYGKCNIIEEDGRSIGLHPKRVIFQNSSKGWWGKYFLKFYNFVPHQAVFIKKKVFDEFGNFDETISSAMDPDLWLRIREKTAWSFCDRIISNYCVRSGAESSGLKNLENNRKNHRLVSQRYLAFWERPIAAAFDWVLEKRNKNYR